MPLSLAEQIQSRRPVHLATLVKRVPALREAQRLLDDNLAWVEQHADLLVGPPNCVPAVVHAPDTLNRPILILPDGETSVYVALHELGHLLVALVAPTVSLSTETHERFADWFAEFAQRIPVEDTQEFRAKGAYGALYDAFGDLSAVLFAIQGMENPSGLPVE